MKRQTSFKEEIRKSLISHAIIPCVISILVLIVAIMVIGFWLTAKKNIQTSRDVGEYFSALIKTYFAQAEEISAGLSIKDFQDQTSYRVEKISQIYQFLNKQDIRGDFYLFDSSCNMLFSTDQDVVMEEYLKNYLAINRNDTNLWNKMTIMYDNWNLRRRTPPSCLIFKKIIGETGTEGYGGFAIPADRFLDQQGNHDLSLVITNRFERVFLEGTGRFINDRGKLKDEFRRDKGFFHIDGRWYFTAPQEVLNGDVKIFAISDCTAFVQLTVISVVIVAVLTTVMIFFIFMSARTIATKKTDIIYSLIAALKEVEKGNLDVKLDIQSNDEFEAIGNTFNMMLGSIKHLISRHQELARENTLATVQALESQFNPHFLFNTLESIRYMIKFEPKKAEKMIVSFSRLLRYSISKGEEMATLKEEIEFADKYLQIMLYRYGDRLQYEICIDESLNKIEIPRMILQPLVENSIKYGFKENDPLTIWIIAGFDKENLVISVKDNGRGIERQFLDELKENLSHRHNRSDHIGLYNVHRRIHLLYGDGYGAIIDSINGEGTCVTLILPSGKNRNI